VSSFRGDGLLSDWVEVQVPWWPHARGRGWINLVSGGRRKEEGYFDCKYGAQFCLSTNAETSQDEEGRLVFLLSGLELFNETTQFPTPISDDYLQELKVASGGQDGKEDDHDVSAETEGLGLVATPDADGKSIIKELPTPKSIQPNSTSSAPSGDVTGAPPTPTKWSLEEAVSQADLPDMPFRFSEKKRLQWIDKTCTWSHTGSVFG